MTGLRPFVESTKEDAFTVVRELFSPASCAKLDKYLHNPLLSRESSVGDIAYEDDCPVGFQASILRRLYLGRSPLYGVVGGMLAMKSGGRGGAPVLLMNMMKSSIASRDGSSFFFANTANAVSMKMNRLLGVKGKGPFTCERVRFAITYWPRVLRALLPRPTACLLDKIDELVFDQFWQNYLKDNRGLVTSRSSAELRWIFGDQLARGTVVLMGLFSASALIGYIALQSRQGGRRWMIVDWIALRDDPLILSELLVSAVRYLRRETSAVMLESIGFSESAERLLARSLPFRRRTPNNSYLWKFLDGHTSIPEGSWFFGPYDGDRCM